jgi:hypothetical protein
MTKSMKLQLNNKKNTNTNTIFVLRNRKFIEVEKKQPQNFQV